MKRLYTSAIICLLSALAINAVKSEPYLKSKQANIYTAKTANDPTAGEPLLYEDFSRFADGSEDAPGAAVPLERIYHIPASMTAEDGWIGLGLYQAGGTCLIGPCTGGLNPYGYIGTPGMDLGGKATLTLRARRPVGSTGDIDVMLIGEYGPGEDETSFTLTDAWQTYTFTARHAEFGEKSHFQIDAVGGSVLIDDIRIDLTVDRLPAPTALPADNISTTSFAARWEGTGKSYLLNVWYEDKADLYESGTISEGFDGINHMAGDPSRIDTANPSYPAGWTIDIASHGERELATEPGLYASAPQSLVFDAEGDVVISPESPQPITRATVWMRPSSFEQEFDFDLDDEDDQFYSLIQISGYDAGSGKWIMLANVPNFYLAEEGLAYELEGSAVFGYNTTRLKVEYMQKNRLEFYIDDIEIEYESAPKRVMVLENKKVSGSRYTVRNIDPESDYYYNLVASDGILQSDPSATIWVDGISGLRVSTEEASDVSPDGFTARWQRLPHAREYTIDTYRLYEAKDDTPGFTVSSEDFDLIKQGTINNPGYTAASPYDFAANGMAHTHWCATNPCWAAGMAGSRGTDMAGNVGLVYSPVLNLGGNGGNGFDVRATFLTTATKVDMGDGTTEPEGMFVMVLYSPDDTQALAADYFETSGTRLQSHQFKIRNTESIDLDGVIVAFMNKSGMPFFVDKVEIIQDIKAGESVTMPLGSDITTGTSMRFDNLDGTFDHAFAVTASVTRDFETYTSRRSDMRIVRTSSSSVCDVAVDRDAMTVTALNGSIAVNGTGTATVYTPAGTIVGIVTQDAPLATMPGIYIVATPDGAVKVAIR